MTVIINELILDAVIGILENERKNKQKIELNLEIDYKFDGSYYLDYAEVINEIKAFFDSSSYGLLEDAIIALMGRLKMKYQAIIRIKVQIVKSEILAPIKVGVKFEKFFS